MTNEELFQLRSLFRDRLKVENIELSRPRSARTVYSDDFLITADKNPNTRGAELLGFPAVRESRHLLQACAEGRIRFLYICHHDLTRGLRCRSWCAKPWAKLDCVVFQGSWDQPTAALADIQLPGAVYAEKEGTFTNVQGRVQRIQCRRSAPWASAARSRYPRAAGGGAGSAARWTFRRRRCSGKSAGTVAAFAGMTYDSVGDRGQLLKSGIDRDYVA